MTLILTALLFALPVLFWGAVALAVLFGPVRHRFWRGERWYGFAAFVGVLAFGAGFFGPMLLSPQANQGPLLGLLITGPLGLAVGVVWGLLRSARRGNSTH
jgi:uncharacterized membrane protein